MDDDITKPNRNLVFHLDGLLEDSSMKNPSTINSVPSIPDNTQIKYTGSLPIISIKADVSGLLGAKRKNNTAKLNPIMNNTLPRADLDIISTMF
jgi:hypothetical protein